MTVTTATLENGMRQVRETLLIHRTPQELYDLWRGLALLPEIMEHVISVTSTGPDRSHWIVKGPAGRTVEWDAEMTEKPAERTIAWHTLPGADVRNAGEVSFQPAPDGNGTEMSVVISYDPPGGPVGVAVARLFGEEAAQQLEEDLKRFKRKMERVSR
jgi:uncharacterized membrane protein